MPTVIQYPSTIKDEADTLPLMLGFQLGRSNYDPKLQRLLFVDSESDEAPNLVIVFQQAEFAFADILISQFPSRVKELTGKFAEVATANS